MTRRIITHGNYSAAIKAVLDGSKKPSAFAFGEAAKNARVRHEAGKQIAKGLAIAELRTNPNARAEVDRARMPRLVIDEKGRMIATDEIRFRGLDLAPTSVTRGSIKHNKVQKIDVSAVKKGKPPFIPQLQAAEQETSGARGMPTIKTKRIIGLEGENFIIQQPPIMRGGVYVSGPLRRTAIPRENIKKPRITVLPPAVVGGNPRTRLSISLNGKVQHFILDKSLAEKIMRWYRKE